jgi:hypothetical protein
MQGIAGLRTQWCASVRCEGSGATTGAAVSYTYRYRDDGLEECSSLAKV